MPYFRGFKSNAPISKRTLSDNVFNADWLSQLSVNPPLELANAAAPCIRYVEPTVLAQLVPDTAPSSSSSSSYSSTGTSTCCPSCCPAKPYSWREVTPSGTPVVDGMFGGGLVAPAYEVNDLCVPLGTIVTLHPGTRGEYVFSWAPACTSSTSSSSSLSSSSTSSGSRSGVGSPCCIAGQTAPLTLHLTITAHVGGGTPAGCLVGATATLVHAFPSFGCSGNHGWSGTMASPPGCSCSGAGVFLCCAGFFGLLIGGNNVNGNLSNVQCDPFSVTFAGTSNAYCSGGSDHLTAVITE